MDEVSGVDVDDNGYIYVVGTSGQFLGQSFSVDFACADSFIAKLDGFGNLITNGFLGGNSVIMGLRYM